LLLMLLESIIKGLSLGRLSEPSPVVRLTFTENKSKKWKTENGKWKMKEALDIFHFPLSVFH
jgi:hypothetical protein